MKRHCRKGTVGVETLLALSAVIVALSLGAELCRRSAIEVSLQHGAFLWARHRALGGAQASGRKMVRRFLSHLPQRVRLGEKGYEAGIDGKAHVRYRAFHTFVGKHHYEVTRKCRFSY